MPRFLLVQLFLPIQKKVVLLQSQKIKKIMANRYDISVMKAVLLYIVGRWSGTQECDVYHIVKAAFYAQKYHLARYFTPLYPDTIVALPYGPVPSAMYDVLKIARGDVQAMRYHKNDGLGEVAAAVHFENEAFSTNERPDMDYLSRSQVECLDDALAEVGRMDFNTIRNTTHQNEWNRAFNDPVSKKMDMVAIAKEEGANSDALEYLKESLELDEALM